MRKNKASHLLHGGGGAYCSKQASVDQSGPELSRLEAAAQTNFLSELFVVTPPQQQQQQQQHAGAEKLPDLKNVTGSKHVQFSDSLAAAYTLL